MESKKQLNIYQVDYVCEPCKRGVKQVMTAANDDGSVDYIHECPNCSSQFHLPQKYPHLVYE